MGMAFVRRSLLQFDWRQWPKLTLVLALLCAGVCASEYDGYEIRVVEEAHDIDAFENGSFEDMSKYGAVGPHAEIGRHGVNANGGLRLRPNGDTIYHVFKLKGRLEKGNRYIFSADVKPHGKAKGLAVLDTFFKGTGKAAPGCSAWNTSSEDIGDGWQHQRAEVIARFEPEKLDYKFLIYGKVAGDDPSNPENYVDVDNIRIEVAAPKWYLCNTWPIHNLVHADEGRIRFNSTFWGEYVEKDSEVVYGCRLLSADGRELGSTVVKPDAHGNFTADFGRLSADGSAKVAVTLYDRTHRLNRGTREFDVTVRTPDREKGLFVRENGVVLKDGKPFMPLGFYTDFAYAEKYDLAGVEFHFRRLRDAGFDTIIDYGTYTLQGERRAAFYTMAEKYGISVIDDSFGSDAHTKLATNREAMRRRAQEIAAFPAHIGWYTMDEAPENTVPGLTVLRRFLNDITPGKIVNTCNIMRAAPYLPTADIAGGDTYPVKKDSPNTLEEPNRRLKDVANCRPAAIWYAPQCFNWARMEKNSKSVETYLTRGREPTFMEMLSVALAMAMNDTTGFFFYSYFEMVECPVPEFREQRWRDMVKIAKEFRALEPFLMSGEKKVEIAHADRKEASRVQLLTDGKGHRRVLVIGLYRDHETAFTLPAEYGGRFRSRFGFTKFEDGQWVFRAKDFTCDILEQDEAFSDNN